MNGLRLAVIYSLKPHQLGLCGPKGAYQKLLDFLFGKFDNSQEIRKILEKFRGFFSYFKLIAKTNKISYPFDKKVVEAYWLGNKLLEKVKIEDFKNLVRKEFKKKIKISKNIFPHHSFHVLYVGSVSKKIKFNEKLKDLCRIGWGRVKKIKNKRKNIKNVLIEYQPLITRDKATYLGEPRQKWVDWDKMIVSKIKKGDWVSFHWDFICQVLNKKQVENLSYYTRKNIYPLNPKLSPVVHVFLKYKNKILILKRSNFLFTYLNLWNCIGGYIEKEDDLLERAIKEVEEETKIKRKNLKLLKKAKPYKVEDKSINKIWIIYPFLFETKINKIKIDWEHITYRWIRPKDLKKYKTVPKLEHGLKILKI